MKVNGFGALFAAPARALTRGASKYPPPSSSSGFNVTNSTTFSSFWTGLISVAPPLLSTLTVTYLFLNVLTSTRNPLNLSSDSVRFLQTLTFPFPVVPCLQLLRRLPSPLQKGLGLYPRYLPSTPLDDVMEVGCTPAGDYPLVVRRLMAGVSSASPSPALFINLCAEWRGPFSPSSDGSSLLQSCTLPSLSSSALQLYVPTLDHREVPVSDLVMCIDALRAHRTAMAVEGGGGNSSRAYVHCKAGHGRSASVGLGWLMYRFGCDDGGTIMKGMNEDMVSKRRVRKHMWKQTNMVELEKRIMNGEVGIRRKGRKGEITIEEDTFTWDDFERKYHKN